MLRLTEMLPSNARLFQAWVHEPRQRPPNVFNSGAFVHRPAVGVVGHPKQYKDIFTLMAAIVKSFALEHLYFSVSLTLNTQSTRHRDMRNLAGKQNMVVLWTNFENGQLWCELAGEHILHGIPGNLISITQQVIKFHPQMQHATMPWLGNRLVLIAHNIRSQRLLTDSDCAQLTELGFRVCGRCLPLGPRMRCCCNSQVMPAGSQGGPRTQAHRKEGIKVIKKPFRTQIFVSQNHIPMAQWTQKCLTVRKTTIVPRRFMLFSTQKVAETHLGGPVPQGTSSAGHGTVHFSYLTSTCRKAKPTPSFPGVS